MPPVITLAACYTDAVGSDDGISFAAQLCQRGAAAVIATETSITDTYATRLLARLYGTLARTGSLDVVAALSQARREVQAELEISPDKRDNKLAALGEWAAVTVLAATGCVTIVDESGMAASPTKLSRPRIAGLARRDDWYFVGRRREQRHWSADLFGPRSTGIVVYGIGGTGKTSLAAEIAMRVQHRDPNRIVVSLTGALTLESLLGEAVSVIRRELLVCGGQDTIAIRALDVAGRADLPWSDRLAVLRRHVLDHMPLLLLLDNFEDNLQPHEASYAVRDEILAGLLAAWVTDPGMSRMLITSRHPFTLAAAAGSALSFHQLGALSRAETIKLAWSLPALDALDESDLEQVWRLVGGHPRSLEYLDALLSGGTARYPDVTDRLVDAVGKRLGKAEVDEWLSARTGFDAALSEVVVLAADDVLLRDLIARLKRTPGADDLLHGVSVYREPVEADALLFQVGQRDESAAHMPDWVTALQSIEQILGAVGVELDESLDFSALAPAVRAELNPHLAVLGQHSTPPFHPPNDLHQAIEACQACSLLTITASTAQPRYFVHRWTAAQLVP
jgi:hypothetical protein